MAEIALPRGHHYAVMWGIPDQYAGMTNSMLHRSRAFVELTGTEVTILTYEYLDDYDPVRNRLRERGAHDRRHAHRQPVGAPPGLGRRAAQEVGADVRRGTSWSSIRWASAATMRVRS